MKIKHLVFYGAPYSKRTAGIFSVGQYATLTLPLFIKGCQFTIYLKTQFKLKILKRTQAVESSGTTNLRIEYLTPKCPDFQKKQI